MAHSLYSIANNFHLIKEPDFTKLTKRDNVKLAHCYKTNESGTTLEERCVHYSAGHATANRLLAALLLERLETIKGFSRHWHSLTKTAWILANVPELREKGAKLLNMGAATGLQAKLFSLYGINVKATDHLPHPATIINVDEIEPWHAVKKYHDYPIYYSEFFTWNILFTIKDILALQGKRTVVILAKNGSLPLKVMEGKLSIEKHPLGKEPTIFGKAAEGEREETTLYVIRKLTQEPLNAVLHRAKVISPQRTADS